jgi:hypothetical protein
MWNRMNPMVLAACVPLLSIPVGLAEGADITGPITNPSNSHVYYLLEESNSWSGAEADAILHGGHLATINDANEQDWVFTTFGSFGGVDRSLWIGLHEVGEEGNFVWASGEPVSYTNWCTGEPNNGNGGAEESCVHMIRNGLGGAGLWNDLPESIVSDPKMPLHGVAEIVPEPSSITLVIFGVVAVLAWWWRRK